MFASFFRRVAMLRMNLAARRGRLRERRRRMLGSFFRMEDRITPAAPVTPLTANQFQINAVNVGTQSNAAVAEAPNGTFVVAWQSNQTAGQGFDIWAQRFNTDGSANGVAFRVNHDLTNIDQTQPAIAVDASNEFIITWTAPDASNTGVYYRRYSASGAESDTGADSTLLVNAGATTGAQQQSAVTMSSLDNFAVAYQSFKGANGIDVVLRTHTAGGFNSEITANITAPNTQQNPSITQNASGNLAIAWEATDADGNLDVFARTFDSAGTPTSGELTVNQYTTNDQRDATVGMAADGSFVVAWDGESATDTDSAGINARQFHNDGTPVSGQFQVNTTTAGKQVNPAIGSRGDGGFIVAWEGDDANGRGIVLQKFNSGGVAQGGEYAVSTDASGNQVVPALGMNADLGRFTIAWDGASATDGQGIAGRAFYFQGSPPTDVYVDDNWAGTVNGVDADGAGPGTGFGFDEFATIQDAINAVADSGTVHVAAGVYTQSLAINKSLSLFGAQFGVDARTRVTTAADESTIVAPGAGAALVDVTFSNVTIDGFSVNGGNFVTRAIRTNQVDNVTIQNTILTGALREIQFNGSVTTGNFGGNVNHDLIQNLTTGGGPYGGSYGVVSFNADYVTVSSNKMTGLDVGIFEQYFYQPNGSSNADNVISDNEITTNLLGYGTNERAEQAARTVLTNNTFNIGSTPGSQGIQLYNIYKSDGIEIGAGNTITGADVGVYAFINGGWFTIADSTITGGAGSNYGVRVTNLLSYYSNTPATLPGSVTISGTSISGFATGLFVDAHNPTSGQDVTVNIGAGDSITGGTTGILADGSNAVIGGETLGDLTFSGQDGQYIDLEHGAMSGSEIDGTAATFDGQTGATATLTQAFAIEASASN